MSDPKLPSCVEPWWPNKTARDYARECVTTEDSIADALAAAEERGRRRGVEERDELRAAIRVALQHLSRVGTEPGFPVYEASKILSAALAPRDSAPCFAELCALPNGHAGEHMARAAVVKPDSGEREVIPCTGLAATWCPVHGDCTCEEMENGERSLDDDDCPLHDRHSTHCEIADDAFVVVRDSVSLPLSLAQRILAALDTHVAAMKACAKDDCGCGPLAAELRDRMPK